MLLFRKISISPLESWLTWRAGYLLPRLDAGVPGTVSPPQLYECPPSQVGEWVKQWGKEVWDAPQMQHKNTLKICRHKMNHLKYRKLVKRTQYLLRKVKEGRPKRQQIKFKRDLKRIWWKAGLKETPTGWKTLKIHLRGKCISYLSPAPLLLLMTRCNKYSENSAKNKNQKILSITSPHDSSWI